ncbi:hypothetical protein FIP36_17145 [Salmonella enterica]|nr:hypothetical protein [Salmonella enterica]
MSKQKTRSKVLLQQFIELCPHLEDNDHVETHKIVHSALLKHAERDNDLIVIFSDDEPVVIELKALKSLALLGANLAAYSSYYHVEMVDINVKKIDFDAALELMKASPKVPMFKSLAELDKFLITEFEKFGLETFLDVENLDYSLEKSNELKNQQLNNWLADIIAKRGKLLLRKRFDEATKAHYETVDELNKAVRPLMKELGFPDDLMEHTFRELTVFDPKGWDNAIKPKIEFLADRENQYLDNIVKEQNRVIIEQSIQQSINQPKPSGQFGENVAKTIGLFLVVAFVFNKFYL